MRGSIDILVATQYSNGRFVQIFRSLYYHYTPKDLLSKTKTNEGRIYWLLKDNIDKINVAVDDDDIENILLNIHHLTIIYKNLPDNLEIVQRRMPRLLISFYEKIETFLFNICYLVEYYTNLPKTEEKIKVLHKLITVKQLLKDAKRNIMIFWQELPIIFFRMPLRIIQDEITVELFSSVRFLPYMLGDALLPSWTDPEVISVINETRKMIQTKEQTKKQKKDYYVLLRLHTQNYQFDWAIKLIIDYLPITLSFDLMESKTPLEFSLMNRVKDDITVFVT